MQIVIEIDDKFYEEILSRKYSKTKLEKAVADGKPLPNRHGRLKDADKIARHFQNLRDSMNYYGDEYEARGWQCYDIAVDEVMDAPTIIEADRAESEE